MWIFISISDILSDGYALLPHTPHFGALFMLQYCQSNQLAFTLYVFGLIKQNARKRSRGVLLSQGYNQPKVNKGRKFEKGKRISIVDVNGMWPFPRSHARAAYPQYSTSPYPHSRPFSLNLALFLHDSYPTNFCLCAVVLCALLVPAVLILISAFSIC